MKLVVDDYDEDLNADPIKLCFDEHHSSSCRLNSAMAEDIVDTTSQIQTIDLTGQSRSGAVVMPRPIVTKGSDVCYEIKQLAVQLVDFKKCPWYFKRYIKECKQESDITKGVVFSDNAPDICMKIKYDTNKGQWKVHEGNLNTLSRRRSTVIPNTIVHREFNKIDFKRNKGLVGMTITQMIKKEKVDSFILDEKYEKSEFISDKIITKNPESIETKDVINVDCTELSHESKTVTPNTPKFEIQKFIDIKSENVKPTSKIFFEKSQNSSTKIQTTELLGANSNEYKNNSKDVQNKSTNSLNSNDKFKSSIKLAKDRRSIQVSLEPSIVSKNTEVNVLDNSLSHSDQIKTTHTKNERELFFDKTPAELTIKNYDKKESKVHTNSRVEKIFTPPVTDADANNKSVSKTPLVSERQVAVIDSSSRKYQDIKKFVEKAARITKQNLKITGKELSTRDNSKPLDMPALSVDNDEKSDMSSKRRMSMKDSIVFENDLNSNEYLNNSNKSQGNTAMASIGQVLLPHNNSDSVQPSKDLGSSAKNTGTVVPTTTPTLSEASFTKSTPSKPRIKYTPVGRDYAGSANHNVFGTNRSANAIYLQSLLQRSAADRRAEYNSQNIQVAPLLNPQSICSVAARTPQHHYPAQQMSLLSAPSYYSNYSTPPGYVTPMRDSNVDYRMYENSVNQNYYYNNMYSSYVPTQSYPSLPPPSQARPQWSTNYSHKQHNTLLNTPNSSLIGWHSGHVKTINISAPSKCNAPQCTVGNERSVNKEIIASLKTSKTADIRNLDTSNTIIPNKNDKVANERALRMNNTVVGDSLSLNTPLKRPYTKPIEAKRKLHSDRDKELEVLSKRLKTSPVPVSSHVKAPKTVIDITQSPPFTPMHGYESRLQKTCSEPLRCPNDIQGNKDSKKMAWPLDKLKKISIEEYKKRDEKRISELYRISAQSVSNTGLVPKYGTKKLRDGNCNLDQDLGYSSDTAVKL